MKLPLWAWLWWEGLGTEKSEVSPQPLDVYSFAGSYEHTTQHAASRNWRGDGGTDVAGESSLEQPNRVLLIHQRVLKSNEYLDMIFEQIKEA